ncbi:DoxX family protein [Massilibacteroides vaginae]|uniref:DoxX family protein n=1 Tax=Massilibacteroides vaginae TaxID=1673718 RepID=UPI000A1C8E0B|nr:DoxX family protein [Massilibacteroides vaginae]
MSVLNKILFGIRPVNKVSSVFLLAARLVFGCTFMSHGWQKWTQAESLLQSFPDPLGVGSQASLVLALFAEIVCPLGFILGFLYRLALVPMIFTMLMAFFVIHGGDPFAIRELSFLYLALFTFLLIIGPGRFSIDSLINHAVNKRNRSYDSYSGLDYSR